MHESVPVADLSPMVEEKWAKLQSILQGLGPTVVAFSGGVDSAFLLRAAKDALGDEVQAFTARSPSMMAIELEAAVALAEEIGARHQVVDTDELNRDGYVQNSTDRCYYCKTELFDAAAIAAAQFQDAIVVDGFNLDDFKDHRPGHRAAEERSVRHPLAEARLHKAEVRALSKRLGLSTWNKPQLACLASRIPYGTEVTAHRLSQVERVETYLRQQGFFDVRARIVNDEVLRIEVGAAEIERVVRASTREPLVEIAKAAGFRFVTLDLEGFRSGRMNEGALVQLGPPKSRR